MLQNINKTNFVETLIYNRFKYNKINDNFKLKERNTTVYIEIKPKGEFFTYNCIHNETKNIIYSIITSNFSEFLIFLGKRHKLNNVNLITKEFNFFEFLELDFSLIVWNEKITIFRHFDTWITYDNTSNSFKLHNYRYSYKCTEHNANLLLQIARMIDGSIHIHNLEKID